MLPAASSRPISSRIRPVCRASLPSRSAETSASPVMAPALFTFTGRKRMPASPGSSMAASTSGSSSTMPRRRSSASTFLRRSASLMARLPATTASRAGRYSTPAGMISRL